MNLPGFTAESSLCKSRQTYHGKYLYGSLSQSQSGLSANVLPSQLEGIEGLDEGDEFDLMDETEAEDAEIEEEVGNGEE
jgi:hypothetical protein